MGLASPFLRNLRNGFAHWCPGCNEHHVIYTSAPNSFKGNPVWTFNGDVNASSFSPSVNTWSNQPGDEGYDAAYPSERCHYFLKRGGELNPKQDPAKSYIQFLGDCTHALKGQTMPLPELPKI